MYRWDFVYLPSLLYHASILVAYLLVCYLDYFFCTFWVVKKSNLSFPPFLSGDWSHICQLLKTQHAKVLSSLQGFSHLAQQGEWCIRLPNGQHSTTVHACMTIYVDMLSLHDGAVCITCSFWKTTFTSTRYPCKWKSVIPHGRSCSVRLWKGDQFCIIPGPCQLTCIDHT